MKIRKKRVQGHTVWQVENRIMIIHFNRHGGKSQAPYNSLNVSPYTKDLQETVKQNLQKIRQISGAKAIMALRQVHGSRIIIDRDAISAPLKKEQCRDGLPPLDLLQSSYWPVTEQADADGLMTNSPGLGLLIRTADCQAVTLVDMKREAIANLHCGWRGIASSIMADAAAGMRQEFQSRPEDMVAIIGPSLGPCCAEFKDWKQLLPDWMHPFVFTRDGRPYINLWAASAERLASIGIPRKNIMIEGTCTACSTDYFSYRREKETGRNGTLALII